MLLAAGHDDTHIAASWRPGTGPGRLVLVHATGFCKEVWRPVAEHLPGPGVLAIDQRGHGDSSTPEPPFDWWDLGRDVLSVLDAAGWAEPIGAGHSSGAAALVMGELLRPGTFASLVLIEPIVFPGPYGRSEDNPLTASALRRRRWFPSAREALDSFRGRGPFAEWDEGALQAYVEHGFRAHGDRWVLKCSPETEAEFYRSATVHGAWERLGEIACPVVVVAGAQSDTHPETFVRRQAGRFARARRAIVPESTHFVPMERPRAVAAVIQGEMEAAR